MSKSALADAFLADPDRREVYLVELYPVRLSDGVTVTLRYATESWATLPTETPPNELFRDRVRNAFNVAIEATVAGTVAVLPGAKGGEIILEQESGDLDGLGSTAYAWDGARVVVSLVGSSAGGRLGYADRLIVWEGEAVDALPGMTAVRITLRDPERFLDQPIGGARYCGSVWSLEHGASSKVTFGAPAKVNISGDVTLAARVRFSSFAANNYLCSWRSVGSSSYPFAWLVNSSGWQLYVNSAAALNGEATALSLEKWYVLAVSVTGSTLKVYAWDEATGAAVYASTKTLSSASHPSGDGTFALGEHFGSSSSGMTLDWLGIWNRVLAAEELDALRGRQVTATEAAADSSLKLFLGLEEGTGTTAGDSSASPANGTISGATWRLSLEGGANLEGQSKPIALGAVEACEPVLVYAPTRIYQWHDGLASSVDEVATGGNPLVLGSAYTTFATFLAATTTSGKYDTLRCAGGTYIRLGSNPDKPLTVRGAGDATGGYVSTSADLVRRVVTTRGTVPLADPGGLDTASFSALNTANSAAVGYYVKAGGQETIRAVVEFLLASVGAVAWRKRSNGLFSVWRFAAASGSPVVTLTESDWSTLEPVEVESPAWAVTVRYRRAWRTLDETELASAMVGTATQEFYAREWREVRRTDPTTRDRYRRAREIVVETGLSTQAAAIAECERLLAFWKTPRRGYRLSASSRGVIVDRFDAVGLAANDPSTGSKKTGRLGVGAGASFVALGIGGSQADELESLVLWG